MNKEKYNQIVDSTYESYLSKAKNQTTEDLFGSMIKGDEIIHGMLEAHTRDFIPYTREQFIDKCKTDKEFSERWGLTIEEEELGLDERKQIMIDKEIDYVTVNMFFNKTLDRPKQEMYEKTIPTKLITVIYNNETFEIYE